MILLMYVIIKFHKVQFLVKWFLQNRVKKTQDKFPPILFEGSTMPANVGKNLENNISKYIK